MHDEEKVHAVTEGPQLPPRILRLSVHKDVVALGVTVLQDAILAASLISEAMASITDRPVSSKMDYSVRAETLWFFLHILDRYLFRTCRGEARDNVMDAVLPNVMKTMVQVHFHKKTGEALEPDMEERCIDELMEGYNEATEDYASCREMGTESPVRDMLNDDNLLGKLATRILRYTGQEMDIPGRIQITEFALRSLAASRLQKQVERACKVARQI